MKPNFHLKSFAFFFAIATFLPVVVIAAPGDLDDDGLRDEVETSTGTYVSPVNTGTDPAVADTDGDSLPDGMEVNLGTSPVNAASKVKRPNIIYILADDLGYGDVGCFWQNQRTGIWKFATPGLDTMAAEGAMMTHHYVGAPICASSRASFLQGRHQGHAGIRDSQFDKALPNDHNVASMLKNAGYRTVHIGKSGLAGTFTNPLISSSALAGHPLKRGFDRYFGYLRHLDGHEHYPRNGTAPRLAAIHDDYTPVTDAFGDVYTSDVFTAFAKKTIIEETTGNPDRPFFLYLALDTPHFFGEYPPTASYPAGKGLTGGIQWTGAPSYVNTATNDPAKIDNQSNYHPSVNLAWYPAARKHVSMIRRIDDSVSDILQTLRDLGIDDNTLVVFTSDNGPAPTEVDPVSFQSFAGFEGIKTDILEGGIRVPTIVRWPGKIAATNQLSNIRQIAHPSGQWDWLATFADLAKIPTPAVSDGVSLMPTLTGTGTQKDKGYLYFEFLYGGNTSPIFVNHGNDPRWQMQAIRVGDFMGVRTNVQWTTNATEPFRIYNVVTDPKQSTDVAAARPDLVQKINTLAVSARRKGGGVIRPWDTVLIPAVTPARVKSGVIWKSYEGNWPWLPEFRDLVPVTSGAAPSPSTALRSRADDVGLSFEGMISVPTSGAYQFQSVSNAATCLWIHDSLVIDNDFAFSGSKTSEPVYLSAGLHPFRLYYRHRTGDPVLNLSYSGPGIALQPIPASAFFVEGSPPTLVADEFTVRRNTPYLADVLANDTSETPLTLLSGGANPLGTSSIFNNQLRFAPAADRLGIADLTYTATDGAGQATGEARATLLFDQEIWLPFEEGSGTAVGSRGITPAVTGTLTGANDPTASWTQGKFNGALTFDGVDDQVNFPGLSLPGGQSSRTFSCWVKTSARATPETQTLFSYGSNVTGGRFVVMLNNEPGVAGDHVLRLEVNSGNATGSTPLNDGNWHHVAVVVDDHDGSGMVNVRETKFYIDGVPETLSLTSSRVLATGSTLVPCIGGSNHNASYNFAGSIDDVRLLSSALSDAEVAALYQSKVIYLAEPPPPSPDRDGDGMDNESEEIAGTDPDDASSVLRIQAIEVAGGTVSLSWSGVGGRDYQVEESMDLLDWQSVPGVAPVRMAISGGPGQAAPSNQLSVSFPKAGPGPRFFRLRASVFTP
jgi:arylsulfatase A-like enzyme